MTMRPYLRDGRAPLPARESTSEVMRANRGKDTWPELTLRRALRASGLVGYRVHRSDLPGRPDVSFGRARVAVLVHGCYWHRCPRCHLPLPKTHTAFWREKFDRNRRRDQRDRRRLERMGWRVLTLWECEIAEDPSGAAGKVRSLMDQGR